MIVKRIVSGIYRKFFVFVEVGGLVWVDEIEDIRIGKRRRRFKLLMEIV